MDSLVTPTEQRIALLQKVCDNHLCRVLTFRLTVLVADLVFAECATSRALSRALLWSFRRRAKEDLVAAMMPFIDEDFDGAFYCVSDTEWAKALTHVAAQASPVSPVPLEALDLVGRMVVAMFKELWD
jgi:hypothetical protein